METLAYRLLEQVNVCVEISDEMIHQEHKDKLDQIVTELREVARELKEWSSIKQVA